MFKHSFEDPHSELFRTFGGLGHGQFVCSEADVNRTAPADVDMYDISTGDVEGDDDDDDEIDAVGNAKGPAPQDTPKLRELAKGMVHGQRHIA